MVLSGEALLHGVPADGISYRMPLAGVVLAWHNGHAGPAAREASSALLWAGPVALAFELGALLQGPTGAALAAALTALPWSANDVGMGEEILYKLLVGLAAVLLAWRAQRPTRARSAALGLAVGASLLCRSPLFLFPPLLAAYELARARAGERRSLLPGLGVLLLASYILLVPWTLMNWRVHGRFIPLEDGRADSDVATAAVGLAPNLSGNYRWLAGVPDDSRVLPWAGRCPTSRAARSARASPWACSPSSGPRSSSSSSSTGAVSRSARRPCCAATSPASTACSPSRSAIWSRSGSCSRASQRPAWPG